MIKEISLHPAPKFGSAPFALNAHTGGTVGVGRTVQQGLTSLINLARQADELGYHRFWMSEHHAMPGLAVSSPPLMLARLTAETQRIRLGAGGVMLPNHAPLVIAEQFGTLEALAPGRIDLGLGRAPGTDHVTAAALRRGDSANENFPQLVTELMGFLHDDFPTGHHFESVHAVPGPWQAKENRVQAPTVAPELWILGSSPYSAQLAAKLGRPYAFALQFGDADIHSAMRIYRENFVPSAVLDAPYSMVSVSTIVNEDPLEAKRQAMSMAMGMLRMFKRESFTLFSPAEVAAFDGTLNEQAIIEMYTNRAFSGTADTVAAQLEQLQEQTGVDEITLVIGTHDPEAEVRTLQLLAKHYR